MLGLWMLEMQTGWAADPAAKTSLEDYLKRLGYEPVAPRNFDLPQRPSLAEAARQNQIFVRGELGSGSRLTFLVDTGCGMTRLDPKSARGLKTLGELGVVLEDSLLGKITNSSIVLMDKVKLGRAEFLNQPARAQKLEMDYVATPHDAVLGCDFFCRNFCLLDCRARRLYVRAAKPSEEEASALEQSLLRSGFVEVPIQWKGWMAVDAEVNHQRVSLGIDTGAQFSVLDNSQIKRLSLTPIKHDGPPTGTLIAPDWKGRLIGIGKIGAHEFKIASLKTLQIGSRKWEGIHFTTANLNDWGIAKPGAAGEELQGLLGAEMLAGNGALVDFGNRKLWLGAEK
jgi:predicted aspartyl protease